MGTASSWKKKQIWIFISHKLQPNNKLQLNIYCNLTINQAVKFHWNGDSGILNFSFKLIHTVRWSIVPEFRNSWFRHNKYISKMQAVPFYFIHIKHRSELSSTKFKIICLFIFFLCSRNSMREVINVHIRRAIFNFETKYFWIYECVAITL